MFYFLSKFLPLLVYPLGLTCVLLIGVLAIRDQTVWMRRLAALALLVLGLGSNRLVSMALQRSLERRHPPLDGPVEADAIVVLGGGTREGAPPRPSAEVGEAGDRVIYAARLYEAGAAPRVIVTGGEAPYANPGEGSGDEVMGGFVRWLGVDDDALIVETESRNTYENAARTREILRDRGISRILLVTSATHMPRAYRIFRRFDELTVIPAPTDFQVTDSDWRYYTQLDLGVQLMNLLPQADAVLATSMTLKEYLGIAVYRLRGWL